MKILITGAHFTPAQAVIEELLKFNGIEVVYVGRKYTQEGDNTPSVESVVIPSLGVKFISITSGRLRRFFSFGSFLSLLKLPVGFLQALLICIAERPDVVVSFGGYVGVPVVVAAWLLSIPVLIHEQTLISSLSSMISSPFADKIAVTFDAKNSFPQKKIVVTGNPIREKVIRPNKFGSDFETFFEDNKRSKLPILLITGGNQGSHTINEVIMGLIDKLSRSFLIVHQTGDSKYMDFDKLQEIRLGLKHPERYLIRKFIGAGDWGNLLRRTDIAVTRGGINTLLELAFMGTASIIIPIPYLYKNEQSVNALFFKNLGLGEVLKQSDLNSHSLLVKISHIAKNLERYKKSAKNARVVIIQDSAKILAQQVLILGSFT